MDNFLAPVAATTLLYVEDEEMTRDTVRTILGRRFPDLVIHCAANGALGLQLYADLRPDLVITDIKMPVMNGIEMSRRITELNGDQPIIVTSAHSDVANLIECIEIGISRYVMKPIDSGKLFAAIESCLATLRMEKEFRAQQEEKKRSALEIELLNHTLSAHAEELEVANRDLEAFSYTVSHDLRTPLTNINGYCQLILQLYGSALDPQCKEFIDIIFNETVNMGDLIKTLLDFSRVTRIEMTNCPVDLSELATVKAAGLRVRSPKRHVDFRIAPGIMANGDPGLLNVVLDNLFANACKYTGLTERALIEFGCFDCEGEQVYFVRDNGAGFDMTQAQRLFKPFQRLHSEREFSGFGVGLATVQRIVQRHGGRVWAEGEVGKGASFFFALPNLEQASSTDHLKES
jgi:two-component system, sensor histidine kinase and response regulator